MLLRQQDWVAQRLQRSHSRVHHFRWKTWLPTNARFFQYWSIRVFSSFNSISLSWPIFTFKQIRFEINWFDSRGCERRIWGNRWIWNPALQTSTYYRSSAFVYSELTWEVFFFWVPQLQQAFWKSTFKEGNEAVAGNGSLIIHLSLCETM